jgi:hypothetical protein
MGRFIGVLGGAGEPSHLGGDDELLGPVPQDARQHAFGPAIAIDVRVVEVVDPLVQGEVDGALDLPLVHIGPAVGTAVDPVETAHGPTAEAHLRDFDIRTA